MSIDLPQQGRWRLLDRALQVTSDTATAEGDFDVALVEGHFPGDPIVPGVLLLEGLAQTLLLIAQHRNPDPTATPRLAGFDRVRFTAPVRPPATVHFAVELTGALQGMLKARGIASVDGTPVATATLTGSVQ